MCGIRALKNLVAAVRLCEGRGCRAYSDFHTLSGRSTRSSLPASDNLAITRRRRATDLEFERPVPTIFRLLLRFGRAEPTSKLRRGELDRLAGLEGGEVAGGVASFDAEVDARGYVAFDAPGIFAGVL